MENKDGEKSGTHGTQHDEDMEATKEMVMLVRLMEIANGPYQDGEVRDFMDVTNKKCKYQYYEFL